VKPVAVAIMAKAPQGGEVKTRLSPPLSLADAAALYRCFLLDKIEQVRMLKTATLAIAFTPAVAQGFFEEVAPGFVLVQQRGVDLGDRLANSLGEFLATGHPAAVAIDSDTPTLPVSFLQQAVELLTTPDIDVVLGPTQDGGYLSDRPPRGVPRALRDDGMEHQYRPLRDDAARLRQGASGGVPASVV
jgi:glycosyltransferase A (GT-A) superfamily protein (DUF2064 family)